MEKSNMKTAGAVVIILIIALLFSWQYIGQEEKESPMEGEWLVAEVISMSVAAPELVGYNIDYYPIDIHVDGDILTMTSHGQSLMFAMFSDIEAVSMDFSMKTQLFLHGDVLYLYAVDQEDVGSVSGLMSYVIVLTRDGLVSVDDDLPDMDGSAYGIVADMYNDNNMFIEETVITFAVEDQDMASLKLAFNVEDVEYKALGLLKTDDKGRVAIFCLTTSGAVFNIVFEDDIVIALTAVDRTFTPGCYIFDRQGAMSEDTYGLGDGTVMYRSEELSYTLDAFYEDGRLCEKRADGSIHVFGLQALGLHGAFAMMFGHTAMVDIDGSLWLIDSVFRY